MEENKKRAYSEIVEILKLIEDQEKLEKIPFEVIEMFKNNSDIEYKPNISTEIPLEEQNLMNETYAILNWIATKYWDIEENKKIEEPKETEEVKEEYVSVHNDIDEESLGEVSKLPMVIEEIKWYKKIKNTIIAFISKIFMKRKKDIEEGV